MTILLILLIGSILLLNLLIFRTMKYVISMTNMIKDLRDNSKNEYGAILQGHTLKRKQNGAHLKSKVEGTNVLNFNSYYKV